MTLVILDSKFDDSLVTVTVLTRLLDKALTHQALVVNLLSHGYCRSLFFARAQLGRVVLEDPDFIASVSLLPLLKLEHIEDPGASLLALRCSLLSFLDDIQGCKSNRAHDAFLVDLRLHLLNGLLL